MDFVTSTSHEEGFVKCRSGSFFLSAIASRFRGVNKRYNKQVDDYIPFSGIGAPASSQILIYRFTVSVGVHTVASSYSLSFFTYSILLGHRVFSKYVSNRLA
jgi:hypothetical protein